MNDNEMGDDYHRNRSRPSIPRGLVLLALFLASIILVGLIGMVVWEIGMMAQ